jgi:hypothetical protein
MLFLLFIETKLISLFGRYNVSVYPKIGKLFLFQLLIVYYFDILLSKYIRFS